MEAGKMRKRRAMMMVTLTTILFVGVGAGTVGWASSDLPFGNGSEDTVPMDHMDPTPFVPVAELDVKGENYIEELQKIDKGTSFSKSGAPVDVASDEPIEVIKEVEVE